VGGTALAGGIGERIVPLEDLGDYSVAIVVPAVKVSTGLIFSRLILTTKPFESKIDIFLETRDFSMLENHLEAVTFRLFPAVKAVKDKMKDCSKGDLDFDDDVDGEDLRIFSINFGMEALTQ
jgi:4-diphosphocytidyl-2-C-methyl-D-erythritol kinase